MERPTDISLHYDNSFIAHARIHELKLISADKCTSLVRSGLIACEKKFFKTIFLKLSERLPCKEAFNTK